MSSNRSKGRLFVLRADSARDHVRPVDTRTTSRCTKVNNIIHHTNFMGRFHNGRPSVLLLSYKSVSRNAPCCGFFGNRLRIGVVGLVNCSTVAVNGRRFSFKLRGVTRLFHVTSFPIIYSGCSIANAMLRKLIGPCVALIHRKIGVKVFNLTPGVRKLIRTSGYVNVICGSPVGITRRVASLLERGRGYRIIVYVSRLNVHDTGPRNTSSRGLMNGAHNVSIVLKKRSRAFVRGPTICLGTSNGDIPILRAKGDNVCMKRVMLALARG